MKIPQLSELRKEHERESGRLSVWMRWLVWLLLIWVFWVLLGFFVVPPILRSQLQKRVAAQLHREVVLGAVRFNPLTLAVTLENLTVAEPDGGGQFLGWKRLYVNFDSFSFLLREWRFQTIELEGFSGRVAVAKDGKLNFADLLGTLGKSDEQTATSKRSWPLAVRRLTISEAMLSYSDASRTEVFNTVIGPTSVSLRDFYTGGTEQAPGEFSATTESGETLTWRGTLSFAPLSSAGEVELGGVDLKKYAPFYADRVRFALLDGRLNVALHYNFTLLNGGRPALRISEGKAELKTLKIARPGEKDPVVALDKIEVTEIAATWPTVSADVGHIAITGGSVLMRRQPDGVDLVKLLTPVGPENKPVISLVPEGSAPAMPPPNIKLGGLAIRGLELVVEDHVTPRVARHQFTDISCDLRNLSLAAPNLPMPFGFRANLAPKGEVHIAGSLTLSPLATQLGVELTDISLANFSPYAEALASLRIGKGRLNTALYFGAETRPGSGPVFSAQGDVSLDDFAAYDAAEADELVSWRNLSIKGLEFGTDPSRLLISDLLWTEPSGHLIVNKDGTLNLALALKPAGAAPTPVVELPKTTARPQTTAEAMMVSLDRFVLEKAAIDFTDRSLQPNVHVTLNQLNGQVEGLSSSELARASVDIRGWVDSVTPIVLSGKLNPLTADAFTDLKLTMKAMELAPVGPYVGKFSGYELEQGDLSLDVKCHINKRKLDCTNTVTIDRFTLGNSTNSPDATHWPVKLVVKLLRDASGRIILDPPIRGSIDDPEIRTGRIIFRVFTNIFEKVATAPFAFIGLEYGAGKDVDLSYLEFKPGENNPVNDDEIKKLDVVAKAMKEHPELLLEIVGGYDEVLDASALRERTLENQMRNIIWNDRRAVEPTITLDEIQIDPVQRNGMIRRLYYKAFPNEKPKRLSPGDPGYAEETVSSQKGDLGAFQRKKSAGVPRTPPKPQQPLPQSSTETSADGKTETATTVPQVTEIKPPSFDEMKARLLTQITVDTEAYRKLAVDRANAVREYLINYGEVPAERLSLSAITSDQPAAKGTHAELRMK